MSLSGEFYDFTYNNYREEGLSQLIEVFSKKTFFKKSVGYYEIGESGTPHIQGYFQYCKKTTKGCILKESGINDGELEGKISMRICKNIFKLKNYVKKDKQLWWDSECLNISDGKYWSNIIGFCNVGHKNLIEEFNINVELAELYKKRTGSIPSKLYGELYDLKYDYIKNCEICKHSILDYEM